MARIVITEIMDAHAVARLQAHHDVLYDPLLVDDAPRLNALAAGADALIVRNRTQVRGELSVACASGQMEAMHGEDSGAAFLAGCRTAQ